MNTVYKQLDALLSRVPTPYTAFIGWVDGYPRVWELVRVECDERSQVREMVATMSDAELLAWARYDANEWRASVWNGRDYTGAPAKLLTLLLALETPDEFERWKRLWDALR